jgi:enoyl-CoA hydratase/carnithine racemase
MVFLPKYANKNCSFPLRPQPLFSKENQDPKTREKIMNTLKIEQREGVTVLRLSNGVTNAISPLMVDELSAVVAEIGRGSSPLVFAGNRKFFSMGFDLPTLLSLNRSAMSDYFYHFNEVTCRLLTLPVPVVGALAGHAVAGGYILTLTCDYRVAGSGRNIGLNEIKLGVPVPYLADLMLRQIASGPTARRMLDEGNFVVTEDAERLGLVNEVEPPENTEARAIRKARELGALPGPAWAAIKANRVESIQQPYEAAARRKNEIFLDCWFSDQAQELLKEASRKF